MVVVGFVQTFEIGREYEGTKLREGTVAYDEPNHYIVCINKGKKNRGYRELVMS